MDVSVLSLLSSAAIYQRLGKTVIKQRCYLPAIGQNRYYARL
ncbi:hypothetical protein [Psychrobacter sp. UBA5136]|nr:hypothetical protein [Psychrobacter sp. UBA5136]